MRSRSLILLAAVVLAASVNLYWIDKGIPVQFAEAPVARIACVSYAPYRKPGETPFDPNSRVSSERIDEDLAALSRRFDCIRTYSVGAGLDQVPAIARRHGMKVYLGIWLSRSPVDNAKEMTRGIEVARANRDVVRAVIVGNEVLLRGELTQSQLAADIRQVATQTGLPVTYADVWEFWLKYREVEKAVSFVTIHILPYWEDEPMGIEDALDHVKVIRAKMQAAFPDREILIGETGWPSRGRERRAAVPSLVNQARFIREFLRWAEQAHINYNVIEAFDQPWKRQLEGTVGGYWGIYDANLEEKFGLAGPVVEEKAWRQGVLAGVLGAIVFALAAALARLSGRGIVFAALAGDAIAGTLYAQITHIVAANRTEEEWVLTGVLTLVATVVSAVLTRAIARGLGDAGNIVRPAGVANAWSGRAAGEAQFFGLARGFLLCAIAIMNVLLVFDARYRDFPTLLFAPCVCGFAMVAYLGAMTDMQRAPALEERVLQLWLLASAILIVALELPSNHSADLWSLLCIVFALSLGSPRWMSGRVALRGLNSR